MGTDAMVTAAIENRKSSDPEGFLRMQARFSRTQLFAVMRKKLEAERASMLQRKLEERKRMYTNSGTWAGKLAMAAKKMASPRGASPRPSKAFSFEPAPLVGAFDVVAEKELPNVKTSDGCYKDRSDYGESYGPQCLHSADELVIEGGYPEMVVTAVL